MAEPLPARLDALETAVLLGRGRLDDAALSQADDATRRARERLAKGASVVVVALAGGTGSGKSSLFNALAGEELARVGAVRPVTAEVSAWVTGELDDAVAVLDWLDVRRRTVAPAGAGGLPDGLVLLDLPDHDSVAADHRQIADRFVARVDAVVWVVDPLKYAQRNLHDHYLRRLSEHAEVLLFVLNRADTVGEGDRARIMADLRRLLDEAGLERGRLLATSARSGEGVPELRAAIAELVRTRRAVAERIDADLRAAADGLRTEVGRPRTVDLHADRLVVALADAAGAGQLADAGARTYREDADDATRPVLTGVVLARARRLRRPLRRRRLPAPMTGGEPSPVAVRHALGDLAARASAELPHPWPARLATAADDVAADLPESVAKAVDRVPVHDVRRRWWWPLVKVAGTVLEMALVTGLVWLTALAVLAWLRLPEPPTPELRGVPWPTLLAVGGGLALLVANVARRRLVRAGADRHGARVHRRLRTAIATVADEQALGRLRDELDAHNRVVAALAVAAGRRDAGGWQTSPQ